MKALISILFLILVNSSFAEDMRYYDVEVIIIENLSKNAKNAENWPLQVNLNPPEKTVQLGEPVLSAWLPKDIELKSSYVLLNPKSYLLTNEVKKISDSKKQRVIFHTAWRQPGLDKHQALPVYFKREVPVVPIIQDNANPGQAEELLSLDVDNAESRPTILEGLLRITLARYLHLEAELSLRSKLPEIVDYENPFAALDAESERNNIEKQGVIHLKQNRRRIRSNELHYLDHPVLGILIRITPYEKPEDTANG